MLLHAAQETTTLPRGRFSPNNIQEKAVKAHTQQQPHVSSHSHLISCMAPVDVPGIIYAPQSNFLAAHQNPINAGLTTHFLQPHVRMSPKTFFLYGHTHFPFIPNTNIPFFKFQVVAPTTGK